MKKNVTMNVQRGTKTPTFVITVWPPVDFTKSHNLLAEAFSSELPPGEKYLRESHARRSPPYL